MPTPNTGVLFLNDLPMKRLGNLAGQIENWGYNTLWMADERFFREVYSCLTVCAHATNRINLGTCVTDPYTRHPALTAMAIATIDEISKGRAILGMGAGISGFAAMGIKWDRPARALRESVELIRALLKGEKVDYNGDIIKFKDGELNFKPIRSEIPIYLASNSPMGLRAAGRVADGVIASSCANDATVGYIKSQISKGASSANRDLSKIEIVSRLNCCISSDSQAARQPLRRTVVQTLIAYTGFAVESGVEFPASLKTMLEDTGYTHDPKTLDTLERDLPDSFIDIFTLAGTVEEVADRVIKLAASGVTDIMIRPLAPPGGTIEDTLETFATKVMPRVRDLSS